jgi:hypothetical protein
MTINKLFKIPQAGSKIRHYNLGKIKQNMYHTNVLKSEFNLQEAVDNAAAAWDKTKVAVIIEIPQGRYNFEQLVITRPMTLKGGSKKKDTQLLGGVSVKNNAPMVNGRFEGIPKPGVCFENLQITNRNGIGVWVNASVCRLKNVRITECGDNGLEASSVDDDPMPDFLFKSTQAVVNCENVKVVDNKGSGIVSDGTALVVLEGLGTKVTNNCTGGYNLDFGLKVDIYYKASIHIVAPLTKVQVSRENVQVSRKNGLRESKNFGVGEHRGNIMSGNIMNIKNIKNKVSH